MSVRVHCDSPNCTYWEDKDEAELHYSNMAGETVKGWYAVTRGNLVLSFDTTNCLLEWASARKDREL